MVNLNMIDTISHGIKDIVFERQIQRCFPLPDYEFSDGMSLRATIYGLIINENFTRLLFRNQQLDVKWGLLLQSGPMTHNGHCVSLVKNQQKYL